MRFVCTTLLAGVLSLVGFTAQANTNTEQCLNYHGSILMGMEVAPALLFDFDDDDTADTPTDLRAIEDWANAIYRFNQTGCDGDKLAADMMMFLPEENLARAFSSHSLVLNEDMSPTEIICRVALKEMGLLNRKAPRGYRVKLDATSSSYAMTIAARELLTDMPVCTVHLALSIGGE